MGRFENTSLWNEVQSALDALKNATFGNVVSLKSQSYKRATKKKQVSAANARRKANPQSMWICPTPRSAHKKNLRKKATQKKFVLHFYQRPGSAHLTAGKTFHCLISYLGFKNTSFRSRPLERSEC